MIVPVNTFSTIFLLILFSDLIESFVLTSQRHGRSSMSMVLPIKGGSVVALVTPMADNGAVDHNQLTSLLQWHVKEGTDGAVVLGTTGEGSIVSMEERREVIKTAVKAVNGAFPVIIGTGTVLASKVIEMGKMAKELGADGTLVITPYYVKPPQRALISHYMQIADAVDLPMILYNCPGRTGVDMQPETVAEISKHPNVVGIKDATGDLSRVAKFRSLCKPGFLIYSGEDDQGCEHMLLGGDGVISVTSNVVPAAMHRMLSEAKNGNSASANEINDKLALLHKRLFLESNPIAAKFIVNHMGKIGSGIRPPLAFLDTKHHAPLIEAFDIANSWKP